MHNISLKVAIQEPGVRPTPYVYMYVCMPLEMTEGLQSYYSC
jgi:hypothetical protein